MSNVFDQFDAPLPNLRPEAPVAPAPQNPFDQFDTRPTIVANAPPAQTLEVPAAAPQPVMPPAQESVAPTNVIQEFTQGFRRGASELDLGAKTVLPFALGLKDDVTFAREAAAGRRYVKSLPKSEALSAAEQKNLGARLIDPSYVSSMLGTMAPGTGASILGSAVGALGGPAGAIAGLGASSALIAYGSRFMEYLETKGVRTDDEAELVKSLQDRDLVNEAHWYAAKASGAEGLINVLGGAAAGKIAPRFFAPMVAGERVAATAGQKLGGAAALTGVGSATEAGAEAAAQLSTGGIRNPEAIVEEGAFGLLVGAPTLAVPAASAAVRAGRGKGKGKALPSTPPAPPNVTLDKNGIPVLDPKLVRERVDVSDPIVQETSEILAIILDKTKQVADPRQLASTIDSLAATFAPFAERPVGKRLLAFLADMKARGKTSIPIVTLLDELAPTLVSAKESAEIRTATMQRDITLKAPGAPEKTINVAAGLDEAQRRSFFVEPQMASVVPDTTRLYRVEAAKKPTGVNIPAWVAESQEFQGTLSATGRWFASDLANVSWYLNHLKNDGIDAKITFIDMPNTVVEQFRVSNLEATDEARRFSRRPEEEFFLPKELAATRKELTSVLSKVEAARLIDEARRKGYEQVVWPEALSARLEPAMREAGGKVFARDFSQEFGGKQRVRGVKIPEVVSVAPDVVAAAVAPALEPSISQTLGQKQKYSNEELQNVSSRIKLVIDELKQKFGLGDIGFRTQTIAETDVRHKNNRGWADPTKREIVLLPENETSIAEVYSTAAHELGHFIAWDKLAKADVSTQIAILAEYGRFIQRLRMMSKADVPLRYQRLYRDSVADVLGGSALFGDRSVGPEAFAFSLRHDVYWHSFSEWFAQQVARWATTDQKPLGVVEKFFAGLAKAITRMIGRLYKYANIQLDAAPAVEAWLNAFMQDVKPEAFASIYDKILSQTMLENQAAMASVGAQYVDPVARTNATDLPRLVIGRLFGGRPPKELKALPAFADKINKFYNLMLGVVQLAKQNPHVRDLVLYNEKVRLADLERVNIVSGIMPTVKRVKRLSSAQISALSTLLDDYGQMRYRTDEEIAKGVERLPTDAELVALARRVGANEATVLIFEQMRQDYDGFLTRIEALLKYEAGKLPDLAAQAQRLGEIEEQIARFRRTPYVPQVRFGRYTVTVRTKDGQTLAFATAESKREQALIAKDMKETYPLHDVNLSILQDSTLPLRGMPPGLLRLIIEKLDLDPDQRALASDLQFELAPAQSFKHRLQRRRNVAGYSKDFLRSYASYFMHGANYLVRAKYADELQGHVKATHEQSRFMGDGNKRAQIANYMAEHLREWLDPKPDWWRVKAAGFLWALGYNAKSALVNLTSIPLLSYAHLARGFGDLSSMSSILKAGADVSTYYRKASLDKMSEPRLRMLAELYNEGTITEALAPQLAGVAEGRNLIEKFAGSPTQRAFQWLLESASWAFQLTEQMNRRITAVAAFDLAMQRPDAKYVKEALLANPLQYQRLIERGFNPIEAAAITVAKDATETTQGIYTKSARPTFMRGRKGAIFQFKGFQQNTLWTMWNYPATGIRSMLVFAALGGLLGVPLTQDLFDLLKVLGWQLFGKDFDLEREARQYLIDFVQMSPEATDGLMHGTSRYGFGIPVLMDLMGFHSFSVDASGVGLGPISPVELSSLFGPVPDKDRAVAQAVQRGAGAGLGLGFAAYNVLTDPTNEQAWMRLIPRAVANVWRAYSAAEDKGFTRPDGSMMMPVDPTNAEDTALLIAQGMGYSPTVLSQMRERERAIYEVTAFWDLRRETLMRQFAEAIRSGDQEDRERMLGAIRQYNADVPQEFRAKRISSDDLKSSVQARQRRLQQRSAGVPTNRRDAGIAAGVGRLYPQAEVISQRPVR